MLLNQTYDLILVDWFLMKSHGSGSKSLFKLGLCADRDDATKMVALLSYSIISEIAAFPSFTGITMSIKCEIWLMLLVHINGELSVLPPQ